MLNKSLAEDIEIKKNTLFQFSLLKTKASIEIKHERQTRKKQALLKILKKNTKEKFF